jgi:hypothetical protein
MVVQIQWAHDCVETIWQRQIGGRQLLTFQFKFHEMKYNYSTRMWYFHYLFSWRDRWNFHVIFFEFHIFIAQECDTCRRRRGKPLAAKRNGCPPQEYLQQAAATSSTHWCLGIRQLDIGPMVSRSLGGSGSTSKTHLKRGTGDYGQGRKSVVACAVSAATLCLIVSCQSLYACMHSIDLLPTTHRFWFVRA